MDWTSTDIVASSVGAVIGGLIAGAFSYIATAQAFRNESKRDDEEEKRFEFGLLQALHDEIFIIWTRYNKAIGQRLEALPESAPLTNKFPVRSDYFPVFRGNTASIGKIKDDDIRRAIITVYTKASGMVDSYQMNNELIGEYVEKKAKSDETKLDGDIASTQRSLNGLVHYANGLKELHAEIKSEIAWLLEALQKKGVRSASHSQTPITMNKKPDYIALWIAQSEMLWSRLQTIAALQSGVFVGWFYLNENRAPASATALAAFSIVLSLLIARIVWRDGDFLYKTRKAAEPEFPFPGESKFSGSNMARGIAVLFILADVVLGLTSFLKTIEVCS